jgi:sugar-specific transcriptional regulator TrmB
VYSQIRNEVEMNNENNIKRLENAINELNSVETPEQLFSVWMDVSDILGGNQTVNNLLDVFNKKHSELYRTLR